MKGCVAATELWGKMLEEIKVEDEVRSNDFER